MKPKPYSILLVDDEISILRSIKLSLTKRGYKVDTANNGEQAVEMLGKAPYDLVISDLLMPGISGMEVLKETKKTNPDTIVIILTAHGTTDSLINAKRNGVTDYILKPVVSADLHFRISTCLEKQGLQKQIKELQTKLAQYEGSGKQQEAPQEPA